ncbi:MAG: DUF4091 domain-containing protein [Armatimonadetes bacterium]|nr:DUF4091 domain-containing protein [Armatimonadota bacterium]
MGTLTAAILLMGAPTLMADTVRLEVTGDTSIAAHESEVEFNLGGSSRIRIKGIQHFMLMKFDLGPVTGRRVERATLRLRPASEELWLRTVGVSTVSSPWEEGTSGGAAELGACCFAYAAYPDRRWAGPQSDFTDVAFGVGNTLVQYTDIRMAEDGWIEVDVAPELVQAMICGDSYGLVLSDEKGQTAANNDVYSREQSASRPYLMVEVSEGETATPAAPRSVTVEAAPDLAHLNAGGLRIRFTAPEGGFTYTGHLAVGEAGQDLPRHLIPHARPGEQQVIEAPDLPPDAACTVTLAAIDAFGNRSAEVTAQGRTSAALEWAELGRADRPERTPALRTVFACPSTVKVSPTSWAILEETGAEGYGGVWLGKLVRGESRYCQDRAALTIGRGGFASFQVIMAVPEQPTTAQVRVTPFACDAGETLGAGDVELFRVWYVKDGEHYYPEVAVPTDGALELPTTDNAVPQQLNQAVWVDLYVPKDAAVGEHAAQVEVTIGEETTTLPIALDVSAYTYPDELNFNLDLNGYGTVGDPFGLDDRTAEYRALEREYHRLAHKHRATLDLLGYSHSGKISSNYAPPVEERGADTRITDWSAWDEQFGPYLSGEAFADLPRAGVPVHNLYLCLHEAWPARPEGHYEAPPVSNEYPLMLAEHAMRAKPVEEAFSPAYQDAFRAVSQQIAERFAQRGWTRTDFHCYQNNKHYYKDPRQGGRGTSWWCLDEPMYRDDWLALEFFARLFRQGVEGVDGPRMVYREDLSRPQWQRDWLRDEVDLMVLGGELFRKHRRCLQLQRENGAAIWNYGEGHPIGAPHLTGAAWVLRAYLAGADAMVPWNNIGSDASFERAEPTAILYPGKRFGIAGPVASLRLKVWRDAAQDAELLIELGKRFGWNREQLAAALASMRGLDLGADAVALEPWRAAEGLTPEDLEAVRTYMLALLSQ